MIEVTALTSGRDVPSARFRIRQHLPRLEGHGVRVREFIPAISKYAGMPVWPRNVSTRWAPHFLAWQLAKVGVRLPGLIGSWRSDVTWLERELFPGLLTLEPLLKRPLVIDVDDAIWMRDAGWRAGTPRIARQATTVIAGNAFIAEWFSKYCRDVVVIPTAVDTDRFRPSHVQGEKFTIAWTGSISTAPYLGAIEKPLAAFLRAHSDAELLVVCDVQPRLQEVPHSRVRFIRWSPQTEAEALSNASVGVMPLPDEPWSRGKCSFKMLQYMACGLPVIVSPVGMNAEVLAMGELGLSATSEGEWWNALSSLYDDRPWRERLGASGRAVAVAKFSAEHVSRRIAEVFKRLAGRT